MLGSVVVGIGIAGSVRMRDLMAPLSSSAAEQISIRGFVSRRSLEDQQGVKQISMTEALSRDDIHVAFICTENTSHEENIRQFLEAGKHVCVEYPMTLSHTSAVDLWNLAQQKGLVLHEEHIELFTPDFKQLKKDISGKTLEEGKLHFTGGPLKANFGFPSFSGIARLTWLVVLFGELTVTSVDLVEEKENKYMKMTAHLLTQQHKPLTWIEERGPGLGRAKHVEFRFQDVTITELPAGQREPVGLFMQDLLLFCRKLQGEVSAAELQAERNRILHCLELADRIQQITENTHA
ncbi:biliverdin reductase A [Danio rerio]|uniref:Biliverdin reductase A n=1 Tax=Danio rerio TaxID=7955 RepID=Q08CI5_DANRE|nr:biliverdin reductase A [Danio rerio]AAI24226.1 Zgc:153046 [Danio rerio]AAI63949.1 Zgc:153046 protein [Danio rerio]|eukprot:NP_001070069.1 biliverdin reductase A [Danio rerio]